MKEHPPNGQRRILQAYTQHLSEVVGLSPTTCQHHRREVSGFLAAVPIRRVAELAEVTPVEVTRYLTARSATCQPAALRQVAGCLRQFLRFSEQRGWSGASLILVVPKSACGALHDLPAFLIRAQLDLLLASWDRGTAEGRRDRAIGLCLARLGLRAGEVGALVLEDLNWRQGTVRLRHSKNGRPAQLPLLREVGEAITDYLSAGRPASSHREVFWWTIPSAP
jgi:site-specific recombinase XerD